MKSKQTIDLHTIKALTFDVFGTVADWRSTIIREGRALGDEINHHVAWDTFADAWRAGYEPAMQRVRSGELPWLSIDALHRMILDDLLDRFGITELSESGKDHLNRVWHRLELWPDVKQGLERLRQRYVVASLSNGNVALLTNMAKHADLRWDCVLSAELSNHYKPDAEVYLKAAQLLGLQPAEVMMVAAHNHDLKGAQSAGLRTAFVYRTTEYGLNQTTNLNPDPSFDLAAIDFMDLAGQLVG
ncbi:MAG: haloacid dehalogenase type II [Spirochaetales bacterium]|nr:haloacid dehalogenase type II [Spirochaetales bacterium]